MRWDLVQLAVAAEENFQEPANIKIHKYYKDMKI